LHSLQGHLAEQLADCASPLRLRNRLQRWNCLAFAASYEGPLLLKLRADYAAFHFACL
jgi:hypothetical protein